MPKKRRVGSGMTEREVVHYDPIDDSDELAKIAEAGNRAISARGGVFAAWAGPIADRCQNLLETKYPDADPRMLAVGKYEPDSEDDFRKRILWAYEVASNQIAEGDAESAAWFAFEMGMAVA